MYCFPGYCTNMIQIILERTLLFVAVLLLLLARDADQQIFSSIKEVQRVAKEERGMVAALDVYVTSEQKVGRDVQMTIMTFLKDVRRVCSLRHPDDEFGENPISAFHLLKRLAVEWEHVIASIWCGTCMEHATVRAFHQSIARTNRGTSRWVTRDDVDGAAGAILRLWQTYQLDLDKLIAGMIWDTQIEPLTLLDVIDIAKTAHVQGKYYEEIVWLEKVLEVYNVSEPEDVSTRMSLAAAYNLYGMPWKSLELVNPLQDLDNTSITVVYNLYMTENEKVTNRSKVLELSVDDGETYRALCRGDIRSAKELSDLKCFLRPTRIPYYRSREEVVNYVPRISLFHDVISANETLFMRAKADDVMTRSMTIKDINGKKVDVGRVSQTGWLKDTNYPSGPFDKINRRIALITGLDTTYRDIRSSVEQYQILNYGLGGMYNPHHDNLNKHIWDLPDVADTRSVDIKYSGERIATWMFYMYPVKAGGATVFPLLKARVPAVEGGAAFWYNILPSGEMDERMLHAGCPVLLGSKWVSNKWIHQEGQVLTKLCGQTPHAERENPMDAK